MLRPFLLIGVGGSGGKTLRVVRDELSRRLEQAGWTGELPRAWQFLHIDVPTQADGNDPDLPRSLPPGMYQGLVRSGITYRVIDAALAGNGRTQIGDAMATWRPDPRKVNIPVAHGAGQYRTLGRVIALAGMDSVYQALVRARGELYGADVVGQLQAASLLLGGDAADAAAEPTVVVVSSIAGGSGAGAVIDVCDAVRALGNPWASESVGILYAPDVFDHLKEEHRRGVRPNSLASLGEILSGYWNTDGPSDDTSDLLAVHGIQMGAANRLGPRYPFLVGSRNQDVAYATQNDVYRAMGRSLAAWVASATLQDQLTAYTVGNWAQVAQATPDALPIHPAGTETPFSALGSARVGLGRDRFRTYASENLARAAVDRVLRRHEELRVPGDDRIERVRVAEIARDAFGPFLAASGLDERGEHRNDIIAAFGSGSQGSVGLGLAEQIRARVAEGIPTHGLPAAEARHLVVSETGARRRDFHLPRQEDRLTRGQAWVLTIQDRLQDQAARAVAAHGAPVTVAILAMLGEELTQVRGELADEAVRYRRWAHGGEQYVAQEIDRGGATITAGSPALLAAVQAAIDALVWEDEAEIRELVAGVIPDLVANVIEPLRDAVQRAGDALRQEQAPQNGGQPSVVASWPTGTAVPQRLRAAPNEFLLEKPADYPTILGGLIVESVATPGPGGARREAVSQVVLGTDDIAAGAQVLIGRTADWSPKNADLQAGILPGPQRAAFEVGMSAGHLLARAVRWLERDGVAVGTYLREGLRDYLDPEKAAPAVHTHRLADFEGMFIAALNASAPLVSINPGVLVQVHGLREPSIVRSYTEIPFPEGSPGRAVVTRILQGRGQWTPEVAATLGDGTQAAIDIFAVLAAPYEPVVFDSLMEPIAREWGAKNRTSDLRAEFWRWRRARSLTEAIPLAPTIRGAMVRGWFTARLLGQLQLDEVSARIWVPDQAGHGGGFRSFPDPLLTTDAVAPTEYLASVLKSILLAMVDVNTRESLEPMAPYVRLRDLGRSGAAGGYDTYLQPSADLRAWIEDGVNPIAPADVRSNFEQRRADAKEWLDLLHGNYTRLFREVEERTDTFDVAPSYDLRHDILGALDDLRRAVVHVTPKTRELY